MAMGLKKASDGPGLAMISAHPFAYTRRPAAEDRFPVRRTQYASTKDFRASEGLYSVKGIRLKVMIMLKLR
jgi:hypothetical protein